MERWPELAETGRVSAIPDRDGHTPKNPLYFQYHLVVEKFLKEKLVVNYLAKDAPCALFLRHNVKEFISYTAHE